MLDAELTVEEAACGLSFLLLPTAVGVAELLGRLGLDPVPPAQGERTVKVVRMGELAVSATADDELVSMGLGSCVGVALVDRERAVAGLAHVMLPSANAAYSAPAKFADRAVPALLACVERLGAQRERMVAVLAGGAQMFARREKPASRGSTSARATRPPCAARSPTRASPCAPPRPAATAAARCACASARRA